MANRLAEENSPYLLQHKDNPVDWYPWGEEALEKAREEDKPIFLSIGYAACHWCHVMEHESFEDPATAQYMNEHFVNIKVDREERPDLDNIYMNAVVAMTGHGGWPMSVFLTPEGHPFFGGTYYPPVSRHNLPSFMDVLRNVVHVWKEDRDQVESMGTRVTGRIAQELQAARPPTDIDPEILERVGFSLAQGYDWKNGGWGQAPKFPQAMVIDFLLQRGVKGDKFALDMAVHALETMSRGGMYDVIGGGFARYSVDDSWLVPHFEKMLYDNAQLARAYLHAFLITGDRRFRQVCEETLDFVLREMTDPQGGFCSSLDADSEGVEGKFYVWTPDEVRSILPDQRSFALFGAAYTLTERGNFEGANVLQRRQGDEALAEQFDLPPEAVAQRLRQLGDRLLEARQDRVRPATDDKVLVAWNGLMLIAFAEAGRYLDRDDYRHAAVRNADFLLTALHPEDRLLRSWREGRARHNAYLEDYGALILGLLALYQTDPNPRWYREAHRLMAAVMDSFQDPSGGFFDTREDHENLVVRPKDLQDNATPSGNALATLALLQLAAYTGYADWRSMAEGSLSTVGDLLIRFPTGFGQWLIALDWSLSDLKEVAIIGEQGDPVTEALEQVLWDAYRPNLVAAISPSPPPAGSPPLLEDRPLQGGRPTAYVCERFVCQQPVTSPSALAEQLPAPAGPGQPADRS